MRQDSTWPRVRCSDGTPRNRDDREPGIQLAGEQDRLAVAALRRRDGGRGERVVHAVPRGSRHPGHAGLDGLPASRDAHAGHRAGLGLRGPQVHHADDDALGPGRPRRRRRDRGLRTAVERAAARAAAAGRGPPGPADQAGPGALGPERAVRRGRSQRRAAGATRGRLAGRERPGPARDRLTERSVGLLHGARPSRQGGLGHLRHGPSYPACRGPRERPRDADPDADSRTRRSR